MVEAGRKATGFEDDPRVHEVFTKYRKTHNESVFDADTPEIINCRRSGISSTKPAPTTWATSWIVPPKKIPAAVASVSSPSVRASAG
jgi:hypothetical protein